MEQDRIDKSLRRLRNLVKEDTSKHGHIPDEFIEDDKFLLRFIRVRKFDCDRAHAMLKEYFTLRRKNPKMFRTLTPSHCKRLYDTGMFVVLKERDHLGRKIFLFRTSLWNLDEVSIDEVMAAMFLLLEEMVESEETQKKGVIFVSDQGTLGIRHFKQFSIGRVVMILSVLQGKFPLMCKGLHNVNDPYWLQKLGTFAKPFFSNKLQKRVHFHGDNYPSFHKYCRPEVLPTSLGGCHTWEEVQDHELFQRLYSKEAYFKKLAEFSVRDEK